ncbi:peptidylprolyl isomerase [Thalassospira marina]|uniref:Parvulin-like PPIase n=1 Tax=Thalassospira marina TaxID=2048283 RepID=A0A2N3KUI6_9PROT|nr:peptidylprolyl isomerase [Thalassospira marina]AUG54253.1 peptidylprolyl isomerase [Thalassospira marina]PKR54170.1 peptidylprolyl isomerase [Thalassospira marina]
MLRKTLLAASLASVLLASPAMAQDSAPAEDKVLATVNGEKIMESEVRATQQGLPAQYRQYPFEALKPMLLDREISQRLLTMAGEKDGLNDDAEVKDRVAAMKRRIVAETYLDRQIDKIVTEDAVKKRYDEFVKTNEPENEVHARHILLENEADAKAVIKELDGGADFAELAKEKSTGPSGPNGGDLGFFTHDQMVPEFADAAFKMEPGSYSKEPVKTQFGWHVIKVEETKKGEQPSFEEKRNELAAELTQDAYKKLIADLRADAKIDNTLETPEAKESK